MQATECSPKLDDEQPRSTRDRIISAAANIALATSFVMVASSYPGDASNPEIDCAVTVSQQYLAETESLLEMPDTTAIENDRNKYANEPQDQSETDMAQTVAQQDGLHITPINRYLIPLEYDAKTGYRQPFATYLRAADKYFATYGIAVNDTDPKKMMHDNTISTATPKQLETKVAKQNIIDLFQAVSLMPEEYLAFAGLRTITFGTSPRATAEWNELTPRSLFIDVTDHDSGANANHEVFHGVSNTLCAPGNPSGVNSVRDPEIEQQNTHDYTHKPVPTMMEFYTEKTALDKKVAAGLLTASQEQATLEQYGAEVSFTDAYGATLPSEDAAQIGRFFGMSWARENLFNPLMPHLREKATIWLSRLRKQEPKLFAYINDVMPPIEKM